MDFPIQNTCLYFISIGDYIVQVPWVKNHPVFILSSNKPPLFSDNDTSCPKILREDDRTRGIIIFTPCKTKVL
jgi:hypothetical protein